jgi:nucleotide-binding universal stress UspA family protein
MKLLLAADGSENSLRATDHAIRIAVGLGDCVVHVVTALPKLLDGTAELVGTSEIGEQLRAERDKAQEQVRRRLDEHGVRYVAVGLPGDPARVIADYVREHAIDEVVIGNRGLGTVRGLLLGSVSTKVVHLVDVPVTLVK